MIKKLFIPHHGNNFKPHILREISISIFAVIIFFSFLLFSLVLPLIIRTNLGAAIYTSVLVESTNIDRQKIDLGALKVNPLLEAAAKAKANDMATNGYFAHNSPIGLTPWYWIKQAGYSYEYAGENLAVDFHDSKDVEDAWMNSPTHRANILNSRYTEIGIGIATGMLDGHQTTFVVQMFGSPKVAYVPPASNPIQTPVVTSFEATTSNPTIPEESPIKTNVVTNSQTTNPSLKELKEIVSNNNTFVAVQRVEGDQDQPFEEEKAPALIADSNYRSNPIQNFFFKVVVNPSHSLAVTYAIISFILVLAIILCMFIERRVQHPKNIFYGILLLIIILVFTSMHWIISVSDIGVL